MSMTTEAYLRELHQINGRFHAAQITALQQLLQDLDHLTVAPDVPPLRRVQALVEELIADVEGGGQ